MSNTPDSPAKTPDDRMIQGGNYWTLLTPGIWKVLHAVLQLWTKLADDSGSKLPGSNTADIVFCSDSPGTVQARERVIEACWSDTQLGEVALAAARRNRTDWLRTKISELIRSPDLWLRAKGLCLASLSVFDTPAFEAYVRTADVSDTWVGDQVKVFRRQHSLYQRGLHWFGVFGSAENDVVAWGAWRMLVTCVDARWTTWPGSWNEATKARRLAFVAAAEGDLKRACEEADRGRGDTFLGLRITRVRIPTMPPCHSEIMPPCVPR